MRKIRVWILIAMVLLLSAGVYYIRLPEYKIYWSFINEGADYRETDLYVIVYKRQDVDDTVETLVKEHSRMNGVPDKLNIWLYRSRYDMEQGREFYEVSFDYGKDETEGQPGMPELTGDVHAP